MVGVRLAPLFWRNEMNYAKQCEICGQYGDCSPCLICEIKQLQATLEAKNKIIDELVEALEAIHIDANYAKFHKCGDKIYYGKIAKTAKAALESEVK